MLIVDVPLLLERLGIQARRKGREWWACCPFHAERTPSWQIRDDDADEERHARWRCLGSCHDGGSAVGLVMRIVGYERARDAIAWLRSGVAVDRESKGARLVIGGMLDTAPPVRPTLARFKLPSTVRFAPFGEWPATARNYLMGRGLDEEQVERWGIGFAVDGRLAGRIVLPWRTREGKIGGYTARAYVPGEVKKHLEPGEDEHAGRGWVYGEEWWPMMFHGRADIRSTCVVVEGAFDGFAVERATGLPFGAARGSNLLPGHVSRLSTFEGIVIVSDPDNAGNRFAAALTTALGRHVDIRRAVLPQGSDPAKLAVRDGLEALAQVIKRAR